MMAEQVEMFTRSRYQGAVSPFIADSNDQDWGNEKVNKWKTQLLNAIKEQDFLGVQLLCDSPPGELCDIINQPLVDKATKPIVRDGSPESFGSNCFRFSLPIILAAVHGDLEILDFLCEKGASIFTKDVEGDNVIHALIWIAAFKPEKERELSVIYQKLMNISKTDENKKMLLLVDDSDGLRPVELAAKLGTFVLLGCITDTFGVYKSVLAVSPIARKVRYDVSEYESRDTKGRVLLSPLNFLRMIDEEDMEKDGAVEIFDCPVMSKWINVKLGQSYRMMIPPFLNILFSIMAITLADEYGHSNYTCPTNSTVTAFSVHSDMKWSIFYIAVVVEFLYSCVYLSFILRRRWIIKRSHPSGARRLMRPRALRGNETADVENGQTFLIFHFVKSASMVTHAIVTLTVPNWHEGTLGELMLMNRVFLQIILWMMLLYYVQLLPLIGQTVSGALKCIRISLSFIVVFALFYVSSSEGLRSIARYFCLPQLGYSFDSLYSTFMIMLNMIDMRELVAKNTDLPLSIVTLHLYMASVLGIMLLNYLIALFSEAIGKVETHKATIRKITRLNVAMDLIFFQMELYDLVPDCLRGKETPFYIDGEEYTV